MLYVNLKGIEVKHFPDNTQCLLDFKVPVAVQIFSGVHQLEIIWRYENDEECMTLFYIVNHIKEKDPSVRITLTMLYVPNGRMDRTKDNSEVFTLKYFCKFINGLGFYGVRIMDPHSNVTPALLDRVEIVDVEPVIAKAIKKILYDDTDYDIDDQDFYIFFPDYGAKKRYEDMKCFSKHPIIYANKKRDWKTGEILGLEILDRNGNTLRSLVACDCETGGLGGDDITFVKEEKPLEGKTVLMIDDIISYGGTMYYGAKKLRELGARDVFAYATHCENSLLNYEKGKLINSLEDGDVTRLYTTTTLFSGKHEKITVL